MGKRLKMFKKLNRMIRQFCEKKVIKFGSLLTFHDADHLTPLDVLHLLLTPVHLYTKLDSIPNQFLMLAKKIQAIICLVIGLLLLLGARHQLLDRQFPDITGAGTHSCGKKQQWRHDGIILTHKC